MNTSKTLLQILVEELPKNGGWPEGVAAMAQDADGAVQNYGDTIDIRLSNEFASGYSRIVASYSLRSDETCAAIDRRHAIITREQYEAAMLAATTQATITLPADGWIDWAGGECPVAEGVLVEVKYRHEKNHHINGVNGAGRWDWFHYGVDGDIIAYRLHQPQEFTGMTASGPVYGAEVKGITEAVPVKPLQEHTHFGVTSGPLTQADFERAGITEVDDEADLNECIGQTPEDLDHLEILLLKEISYYAPEIGLGAATKIASGIVSAGYRKQ